MGNYLAKSNKLLRNFEYRRFYYQSNLSTMWKDGSPFSGDDFNDFFFVHAENFKYIAINPHRKSSLDVPLKKIRQFVRKIYYSSL